MTTAALAKMKNQSTSIPRRFESLPQKATQSFIDTSNTTIRTQQPTVSRHALASTNYITLKGVGFYQKENYKF